MNDNKKWHRRLAPHIYDYNYKYGESYYNPQTEYLDGRDVFHSRQKPPEAATYAERWHSKPIYGSVRGLPYEEYDSELSKPLCDRRARSLNRAGSRDRAGSRNRASSRDPEIHLPSAASRLSRGRERKISFGDEDYLSKLPELSSDIKLLRNKVESGDYKTKRIVDDEFNFQVAPTRYRKSTEHLGSEEDFKIRPKLREDLEKEFSRIKNEFKKADSMERGSVVPRTTEYEHSVYDSNLDALGKRRVKREEASYTLPPSGAKVHKSSYSETTKFESSKPPRTSKAISTTSLDDLDFKMPRRSRHQLIKHSTLDNDDDDNLEDFGLKQFKEKSAQEEKKFRETLALRERRRQEESNELSSNIHGLIKKMRDHDLGDEVKFTRTIRASSLDPYDREHRSKARVQARLNNFAYGISKK